MAPDEDRYQFTTTDGRSPSEVVVDAIAFVLGRDPLEVEPLGRTINPNALDSLVTGTDDLKITFEFEGLEVAVRAPDEIVVFDPGTPASIHDDLGDSSTVLLCPQAHEADVCAELVSPDAPEDDDVLAVAYASSKNRLARWRTADGDDPANTAIVSVGDFARSARSAGTRSSDPSWPVSIECVADPTDLAALEATIDDRIAAWADTGNRTVVCFDSVTDLLGHVDRDRAISFLRTVTDRLQSAGALAHFHLHACEHDAETVADVGELFDAVVEVDEDGEWIVDR